jgi:pyridoxal phosphate enzyme (YggS family)
VTGITDHLAEIRRRIARAAAAAGRQPGDITLVGVSKGHPRSAVRSAVEAGLRDLGENYVQEALPKITADNRDVVWHFIGRIQTNKIRDIAENFAWAQTVTSARIAERLSARRSHYGPPLQVCIQVRPGDGIGDGDRAGCPVTDVARLAETIAGLPRLTLRGLMLLPHAGLDADGLRMEYRAVRALMDEIGARGHALDTLSMGMSDDFELAIEEGSTMIRIGTALFGKRA